MLDRSTESLDPFLIAERGRSYKGVIALSQLERLRDVLIDGQGEVRYDLRFAKEDKVLAVTGRVQAELALKCSVCLDTLILPVNSETRLGIVASLEEAARLPENYEPLLAVDGETSIRDIVEDELLLAIPIIPRHEECRIEQPADQRPMHQSNNPFSILADLKSPGDQ